MKEAGYMFKGILGVRNLVYSMGWKRKEDDVSIEELYQTFIKRFLSEMRDNEDFKKLVKRISEESPYVNR